MHEPTRVREPTRVSSTEIVKREREREMVGGCQTSIIGFSTSLQTFFKVGREPWSSGYGRRLMQQKGMGSNPSTVYWMDIFHIYL